MTNNINFQENWKKVFSNDELPPLSISSSDGGNNSFIENEEDYFNFDFKKVNENLSKLDLNLFNNDDGLNHPNNNNTNQDCDNACTGSGSIGGGGSVNENLSQLNNINNNINNNNNNNNYNSNNSNSICNSCDTTDGINNSSNSTITNSNSNDITNHHHHSHSTSGSSRGHHHHHHHHHSRSHSENNNYRYKIENLIDIIFNKFSYNRDYYYDLNKEFEKIHALSDLKYINNRKKLINFILLNDINNLKEYLTIEKLQSMGFKDYTHQKIPFDEMNEIFKYINSENELVRVLVSIEFIIYHQNNHNHSNKSEYSKFIAKLFFDISPIVFYCLTKINSNQDYHHHHSHLCDKFDFKSILNHEKVDEFFKDDPNSVFTKEEREKRLKLFKGIGFSLGSTIDIFFFFFNYF
ncbi:hypothetical protein DDB_G0290839, partial [Dictyostelium discoideum AX4]